MNINVECSHNIVELKETLFKMFPYQEKNINIILKDLTMFNDFYIINDVISLINPNKNINPVYLISPTFCKYCNLSNIKFVININNDYEYYFLMKYFNDKYIDNDYVSNVTKDLKILVSDNSLIVITDYVYDEMFNNILLIETSTFIRSIKLKQL